MRLKLLPLLVLPLLLSGCLVYASGEAVGYVYAVDDGILWDKVWFRTSLESSQSDCYLVSDSTLKGQFRQMAGKDKVRLQYKRHLFTLSSCDNNTNDEITSFTIAE